MRKWCPGEGHELDPWKQGYIHLYSELALSAVLWVTLFSLTFSLGCCGTVLQLLPLTVLSVSPFCNRACPWVLFSSPISPHRSNYNFDANQLINLVDQAVHIVFTPIKPPESFLSSLASTITWFQTKR